MAQSSKVGTYDPREVSLIIAGKAISGFAEGEFITFESNADSWGDVSGGQGEVARYRTVDSRGTFTVRLLKSASDNQYLSNLMNADEKTGKASFPLFVNDSSGVKDTASASVCWIQKRPNKTYSNDGMPVLEWMIRAAHVELNYGSHADISP